MSYYNPRLDNRIPLLLLAPTYTTSSGVTVKNFPSVTDAAKNNDNVFFGTFKTYGGREREVNGVYSIEDTATIETYYRPDILSECRVARLSDGAIFEIINEPENIYQRGQYLSFKVRRVKGKA